MPTVLTTLPPRRATLVLALAVALALPRLAHAADAVGAEKEALAAGVSKLVAARDRLFRQLGDAIRAEGEAAAPVFLRLELKGALAAHHLQVELLRVGGQWRSGKVRVPGWNEATHLADGAGLTLADKTLKGTLKVELRSDGKLPDNGRSIPCEFEIDAGVAGATVAGDFSTPGAAGPPAVPPCRGTLTGALLLRKPPTPPPEEELTLENLKKAGSGPYAEALRLEAKAERIYQEVRALEFCRSGFLPYEEALKQAPLHHVVRPALGQADKTPVTPPLDGSGLGLDDTPSAKAAADQQQPLLRALRAIRQRVDQMRALVEAYEKTAGAAAKDSFIVGSRPVDDPDFGPWYGDQPLPHSPLKPNALPAEAGAEGPQDWSYVGVWRIAGPCVSPDRDLHTPNLPEIVEAPDAQYAVDAKTFGDRYKGPAQNAWLPGDVEPGAGRLVPPIWTMAKHQSKRFHAGLTQACFYAATEVYAESAQERWLHVGVNDYGGLWLNDRLVWTSPAERDVLSGESRFLFQVRFQKGVNRLLFRCDNETGDTFFRMHVCTRGAPRDAAAVRAHAAALKEAQARLKDPLEGVRGWRGDWTGRYPDAHPVTAWNLEQKINVVWRTPLSWSNTTPVIVGERVFTSLEPHTLVCVNKADGRILWQKDSNVLELLDKELLKQAEAAWAAAAKNRGELAAREAEKNEDAAALQAQGLSDAEVQAKLKNVKESVNEFWQLMQQHAGVGRAGWGDFYGHSFPTPVTDGKHIWVKYGTGVAACYDLDGNRQWMVATKGASGDTDICPSPVLLGDKLLMELPAHGPGKQERGADCVMRALDAATGATLWTSAVYRHEAASATPVPLRLTNGREELDVVATGGGTVLRVDDGKILIQNLGVDGGNGTPIVQGDVIYYNGGGLHTAVRLIMIARDLLGGKPLWSRRFGGEFSAGMVYREGLLYGLCGGQGAGPVDVVDAATGELVRAVPNIMPDAGRAYMPPVLAGSYLITADDGRIFAWQRTMPGTMTVVDTGRDAKVLARNFMEGLEAAPALEGDRMYLRTRESLLCLGYTGDAGRAYEAEETARTLLEYLFPQKPDAAPALAVKPGGPVEYRGATKLALNHLVTEFLFAGPFPLAGSEEVLASLGGPAKARPERGAPVKYKDTARAFAPFDRNKFVQNTWFHPPAIDLLGPIDSQPQTVSYYYASLVNEYPRTVRLEFSAPGAEAWLEGVPVKHGQRLQLDAGRYGLLVQVKVDALPPAPPVKAHLPSRLAGKYIRAPEVPASPLTMVLRFWPSGDPRAEEAEWLAHLRKYKEIFERAAKLVPQSETGQRTAAFLREVQP